MQRAAWYWGRARSNPPPGCLWRLWRSASTLTEPFRLDGNIFCWCHHHHQPRMRTHTPIIGGRPAVDTTGKSESKICSPQDPIIYLSCRISGCNCQHHDREASWDLLTLAALKITFRLRYRPTSWFQPPPPASWCMASATQQVSGSSTQEHTWKHIVKWDWECLSSGDCTWDCAPECAWERLESLLGSTKSSRLGGCHRVQLGVYLRTYSRVCLRAFVSVHSSRLGVCHRVQLGVYLRAWSGVCWRVFCEHTVKQAGSVPSSPIGSVLESVLRSVLESILWVYSQAGWECAIECNWECAWERLESFGACNQVHLAVLLNAVWCIVLSAHNSMRIVVM